jgi:hypothetical protein
LIENNEFDINYLEHIANIYYNLRDDVYFNFIDEYRNALITSSKDNLYVIYRKIIRSLENTFISFQNNFDKIEGIDYVGLKSKFHNIEIHRGVEFSFITIKVIMKWFNELYFELESLKPIETPSKTNISNDINPHPRIFINKTAFELFENFKVKNPLADYSFIFRMIKRMDLSFPGIKESEFREWLSKTYPQIERLDKLKLLAYCRTITKENQYKALKQHYKP